MIYHFERTSDHVTIHFILRSMPPGPAYNWFCVLYSVAEILGNAARYRSIPTTPSFKSHTVAHRSRTKKELAQNVSSATSPSQAVNTTSSSLQRHGLSAEVLSVQLAASSAAGRSQAPPAPPIESAESRSAAG